jgi:DNA-binding PadR family transcriptional regulator
VILGTIHAGLAMVQILRATQQGPRTTRELAESLVASGLPVEVRALYPLLRRLSQEGYLASALHLEPGRPSVRRYWTTRRGTLASDHLQMVLAAVAGPGLTRR